MPPRDGGGDCWWFASWKPLEAEWRAASAQGQQQLVKVADTVQKTTYLSGEHWGELSDCRLLQERASARLWELVHRCRKRLDEEIKILGDVVVRMRALLTDEKAIASKAKLSELQRQRYESFLLELVDMYTREFVAKSLIAADVAECERHDTMTLYIASWQMQPHIARERVDEILQLIQNDTHYH